LLTELGLELELQTLSGIYVQRKELIGRQIIKTDELEREEMNAK